MAPGLLKDYETGSALSSQSSDDLMELQDSPLEEDVIEPIAVIGFSLKFPQEATSPEAFWSMLLERRCAMTEWPSDRLNLEAFYHADKNRNDTFPIRGAHFIQEDLGAFDAPFFSITSSEAMCMDPQHRILMETAYRAFENAGIPMEKVSGSSTGVYTGSFADDFKSMTLRDVETLPRYAITGQAMSLLANRLSWFFNLSGPSMNIDTACSSSMIALDVACQGLRNRDSKMALVAGSNLVFGIENMLTMSNMNFFSPAEKCYSFDERANGYSRGEGFGVILVKLLSEAIRDGDTIRAVIRSTGSNQDGRTPGITQPSSEAQAALIRQTYGKAGLDMKATRFFEAHGTGTAIGDPTEANAIGGVFRKHRSPEDPLYIGAVKSNLGHLEGSSGVAGLIKTILVLEKGVIPPNANFEHLNPKIDAEFLNLKFPTASVPWPTQGLRRASVNAFGFGGSNSHVVLDDAYNYMKLRGLNGNHCTAKQPPSVKELRGRSTVTNEVNCLAPQTNGHEIANQTFQENDKSHPKLLVWSAADENGLTRIADLYNKHFARCEAEDDATATDDYLKNLAYTLAFRRSSLPWKSFAIVNSIRDLLRQGVSISRPMRSSKRLGIAYIFTGQGAQYSGMGKELLIYDVFRDTLLAAESCFRKVGCGWPLLDELCKAPEHSNIGDPEYCQPLCTAVQLALIELFRSFGVRPSAVVGHSSGEIAAAYCAGGLSFDSACKVSYFRGKLAGDLARSTENHGAMMSVGASEEAILPYLKGLKPIFEGVTVACINSPDNVTVAGGRPEIDALKVILDADGIFARKLKVSVAYHSPQMNKIADEYLESIQNLEKGDPWAGSPAVISSVTGNRVLPAELSQGSYWVKNMVSPVRFSDAIAQLTSNTGTSKKKLGMGRKESAPIYELLEVGPHGALRAPIKSILENASRDQEVSYDSILVRHVSSVDTTLKVIGRLHCLGYSIAFHSINHIGTKETSLMTLANLPEYPFDHSQKHWYESRISKGLRFRKHPRLDLLGTPVPDWNPLEARWRKIIRLSETPWVEDHKVNDTIIYPAAAMFVMAIEAARQTADATRNIKAYLIQDATFHKAVNVPANDRGLELQFFMRPITDVSEKTFKWSEYRLCTCEDGQWVENCRGSIQVEYDESSVEVDRGTEAELRNEHYKNLMEERSKVCTGTIDPERLYQHFQSIGMGYGPAFQALENISFGGEGEAIAEVRTFDWSAHETANYVQPHVLHPVTLDAAAQLIFLALTKGGKHLISTTIPTRCRSLWVCNSGLSHPGTTAIKAYSKSAFKGYRETESSLFAVDNVTGDLRLLISDLETTTVAQQAAISEEQLDCKALCYSIDWKPDVSLLDSEGLQKYCQQNQVGIVDRVQFFEDVSFLMFVFISATLKKLDPTKSESLKPHIQKYVDWMKLQVRRYQQGGLPHSRPEWEHLSQDNTYVNNVIARTSNNSHQGRLFVAVGQNLLDMIHGKVDPLDFLFAGELVENYYQEIFQVSCCQSMGEYLDIITHKNPELKILEVGAGTGGMTMQVLSSITDSNIEEGFARFAQYDYTDISGSYFEKAEQKLGNGVKKLSFRLLNIENDPVEQGFEAGTYDIVIAGLVLHATRSLDNTLQNVRKLLKAGGKLILFEILIPEMLRTGFVFGLLPGWWLSSEACRQWSPCISEKQWHETLSQNGFTGVDLAFKDYEESSCHEMGLIVSTALEEVTEPTPIYGVTMIIEATSVLQADVAFHVKNYLEKLQNFSCRIVFQEEALAMSLDLAREFLVYLPELEKSILHGLDQQRYESLRSFLSSSRQVLWITTGGGNSRMTAESGLIDGLARVLRSENTALVFVTLALDALASQDGETNAALHGRRIADVVCRTVGKPVEDVEPEYIERNGMLHISRLTKASSLDHEIHAKTSPLPKLQAFGNDTPLALTVTNPGLLDSLRFIQDPIHATPLAPREVEIEVKAVGVNFMDTLTVLGRVNKGTLGGECAGIVSRAGADSGLRPGDRVCAAILDCFKTYARSECQLIVKIPDDLPFAEACAIPVTGVTAQYGLIEAARLQKGESVLVHSATGATGQMAVQLAQHIGAEVYATVGSEEKKSFLMKTYGIPNDHIFYSRNTSFAQGIMRKTQNKGVDVVLNSLSGDSLLASWECVASFGRFVEIGKKDIHSHAKLPMFQFRKNASFIAVDLDHMYVERRSAFRKSMLSVMEMLNEKKLHAAQPLQIYPISEVEDAFRHMQTGKHIGKIAVQFQNDALVQTILKSSPTYRFKADATYVIVGGLGGIGRSIARWLTDRGARNLLLLSRSGVKGDVAKNLIDDLKSQGVQVQAPPCDVSLENSLSAALKQCAEAGMPPVKGCIQGAMVLRDALFEKMTFEEWSAALASKVKGSWNLHTLLPPKLDFFIMLSSIAGIIGNVGQANYAAGNTFEDALAHYRLARGEKGVSLDLGWIETIGKIAETESLHKGIASIGYLTPISDSDLMALLDHYCDPSLVLTSKTCQTVVGLATPAATRAAAGADRDIPAFMQRPTYRMMHQMGLLAATGHSASLDTTATAANFAALFATASSLADAGDVIAQGLARKLSKALSMPPEDIDTSKPLHAYGVDSLLAVELRNWFAKEMVADIAIFNIMGAASIASLSGLVAAKSQFRQASWVE